jgi:rare lipoprotein A
MTSRSIAIVCFVAWLLSSCATSSLISSGSASWYGKQFHGKKTANGEIYDMNALTAAHPKLPFNTKVKVTNKQNGKSVTVRINDRGPFAKDRIIDLSFAAAKRIGIVTAGEAEVELQVLSRSPAAD